jgi:phosphate starvation-inducible PhoH-like protein
MSPLDVSDYFDAPIQQSRKAAARSERKAARNKRAHPTREREPLVARSEGQQDLLSALADNVQVFAIGPAGTGKTYVAARWAIRQVLDGKKDRVCIARPTVSKAKHRIGFLPGDAKEKLAPWIRPIWDAFLKECSATTLDRMQQTGSVEFLAFEHLRGRSLENSMVLLDEAQNCDLGDLKLFLTRTGEGTQVIISGDMDQVDIPDSGLKTVIDMIDQFDLSPDIIEFTEDEVVRSDAAKEWVKAFARKG